MKASTSDKITDACLVGFRVCMVIVVLLAFVFAMQCIP